MKGSHEKYNQLRTDLQWIHYHAEGRWVLCDPIASKYFYLSEIEFYVARLLDGSRANSVIASQIRAAIADRDARIWVELLVAKLRTANLLVNTNSPSQSQSDHKSTAQWIQRVLLSPFAIRIPLLRPRADIPWAKKLSQIVFSPTAITAAVLSWLSILVAWAHAVSTNPSFFFSSLIPGHPQQLAIFGLVMVAAKGLHELGHFLACHRFSVRSKEIGVMLLMFFPALYCDVSDTWKLSSRTQRAFVAFAGIYIELIVAAFAGLIWINTHPGLINTIAAMTFVACSLNTVIVNGNPLVRFDGYYILSDLWGVPNLSSQSARALWESWIWILGGRQLDRMGFTRSPIALSIYALASAIYRFFLAISIVWFGWNLLNPYGFGWIAVTAFVGVCINYTRSGYRFARSMIIECFAKKSISLLKFGLLVMLVATLLLMLCYIPIPEYHHIRGTIVPESRVGVYAPEDAFIKKSPEMGVSYRPNDIVVQMDSYDLQWQDLEIKQRIAEVTMDLQLLEMSAANVPDAAQELMTKKGLVAEIGNQAEIFESRLEALTFRAPTDGHFVSNLVRKPSAGNPIGNREILDRQIRKEEAGLPISRGELLGWFVPSGGKTIVEGYLPESLLDQAKTKGKVKIKLDREISETIDGEILTISREPVISFPEQLKGDTMIPESALQTDANQPGVTTWYLATIHCSKPEIAIFSGNLVTVEIEANPSTFASRLRKYLWTNYRWNNVQ